MYLNSFLNNLLVPSALVMMALRAMAVTTAEAMAMAVVYAAVRAVVAAAAAKTTTMMDAVTSADAALMVTAEARERARYLTPLEITFMDNG